MERRRHMPLQELQALSARKVLQTALENCRERAEVYELEDSVGCLAAWYACVSLGEIGVCAVRRRH